MRKTTNVHEEFFVMRLRHREMPDSNQNIMEVTNNPGFIHPQFRFKAVCKLNCKHCGTFICHRGMKAILLGDTKVQLYSTDVPPRQVQLVGPDYSTRTCWCIIVDVACLGCGNIIGYHVSQPCQKCLSSCNNGHFWMFLSGEIQAEERKNKDGRSQLVWAQLTSINNEEPDIGTGGGEKIVCR